MHDRIVRDGVSVASNLVGSSSGGKHWFPIRGRFSKVTPDEQLGKKRKHGAEAEELADKP